MENRAQNLLNSINENCKNSVLESINCIFTDVEKATTPVMQGEIIKSCLDYLEHSEHGQESISKIMRKCNCLSQSIIDKAKKCYDEANGDIPVFLDLLNKNHIGGGSLHIDEDGTIIGVYSKCYCSVPNAIKDMNPIYCECSAGWFENLFQSVFEKAVNVQIVNTILNGFSNCIFKIIVD